FTSTPVVAVAVAPAPVPSAVKSASPRRMVTPLGFSLSVFVTWPVTSVASPVASAFPPTTAVIGSPVTVIPPRDALGAADVGAVDVCRIGVDLRQVASNHGPCGLHPTIDLVACKAIGAMEGVHPKMEVHRKRYQHSTVRSARAAHP